jgi:hypothetical protein
MKVSLHGSRLCRVAFNERYARQLIDRGILPKSKDRAFIKWERPSTPSSGTLQVASLLFPVNHLALDAPKGTERKPIAIFGAPVRDKAVEFGFFISRDPIDELQNTFVRSNGLPLVYSTLDSGESVSTVVRVRDFDQSCLPTPEQLQTPEVTFLGWTKANAPGQTAKNCNIVLWNDPGLENGILRAIEIGGVSVTRNK